MPYFIESLNTVYTLYVYGFAMRYAIGSSIEGYIYRAMGVSCSTGRMVASGIG